jgi:hypothetical protein
MSKSLAKLQSGLEAASGKPRTVPPRPAPAAEPPVAESSAKPASGRAGQIHLGAWVNADYGKSLMLVQVKTGRKKHELIREAYNDLFVKYDVPVIDEA